MVATENLTKPSYIITPRDRVSSIFYIFNIAWTTITLFLMYDSPLRSSFSYQGHHYGISHIFGTIVLLSHIHSHIYPSLLSYSSYLGHHYAISHIWVTKILLSHIWGSIILLSHICLPNMLVLFIFGTPLRYLSYMSHHNPSFSYLGSILLLFLTYMDRHYVISYISAIITLLFLISGRHYTPLSHIWATVPHIWAAICIVYISRSPQARGKTPLELAS